MTTILSLALLALSVSAQSSVVSSASPSSRITTAPPSSSATASAAAAPVAAPAGSSPRPLIEYKYTYPNLPYKVNPFAVGRGPQSGYNICNSTTAGPTSECQTLIVNDIADFCLWGASTPGVTVGDSEAAAIVYCTKDTHGARLIPPGALKSLQFTRTPGYIQIVGTLDQTVLGYTADDQGGELDPHGADLLGNPVGGLVYSTGLPSGNNATYLQASSWNNFVGGGIFCMKLCDPTVDSPNYCENIYDLIGCAYNMPSTMYSPTSPLNGTFTSCEGELQDVVGTYTGANGQTSTWSQPRIIPTSLPWQPRIPASSNCVTYQSTALFAAVATATPTASSGGLSPLTGAAGSASAGRTTLVSGGTTATGASAAGASATRAASSASTIAVGSGLFGFMSVLAMLV